MAVADRNYLRDVGHLAEDAEQRISRQVHELNGEVAHIAKLVAKLGSHVARDAGHIASDFTHQALVEGSRVARDVGAKAYGAGQALRRDPAPALAAIVFVSMLMRLVMGRPSRRS